MGSRWDPAIKQFWDQVSRAWEWHQRSKAVDEMKSDQTKTVEPKYKVDPKLHSQIAAITERVRMITTKSGGSMEEAKETDDEM